MSIKWKLKEYKAEPHIASYGQLGKLIGIMYVSLSMGSKMSLKIAL